MTLIDKDALARAVSANDAITEVESDQSPLPALFVELGMEPDAAFYVAHQRALRMLAFQTGRDPQDLRQEDLDANKDFMAAAASMFLDGLAGGLESARALFDETYPAEARASTLKSLNVLREIAGAMRRDTYADGETFLPLIAEAVEGMPE